MSPARRIIAADLGADMGSRLVSLILLDVLVFQGTDPRWYLAGLIVAEQAPSILLSPLAGAAVDRMGAGRWLLVTLAGQSILTVALVHRLQPWTILPLYFCFISGSLCFNLGRLAIIPEVVAPHRLMAFNSLNESIAMAGGIIAYVLTGRLIALAGERGALHIAVGIFLASFCAVAGLVGQTPWKKGDAGARERSHRDDHQIPLYRCRQGEHHSLTPYFCFMGSAVIAGGVVNFSLPVLFKWQFGGDIFQWGLMMALYQAGALTAAVWLPWCSQRLGLRRLMTLTYILLALAAALIGLLSSKAVMGGSLLVMGWGFTLVQIVLESLIQQNSPEHRRGCVASRIMMIRGIGYCGTGLAGACLLKECTPGTLILAGALVLLISALILIKKPFLLYSRFH